MTVTDSRGFGSGEMPSSREPKIDSRAGRLKAADFLGALDFVFLADEDQGDGSWNN